MHAHIQNTSHVHTYTNKTLNNSAIKWIKDLDRSFSVAVFFCCDKDTMTNAAYKRKGLLGLTVLEALKSIITGNRGSSNRHSIRNKELISQTTNRKLKELKKNDTRL